MGGLKKKTYEKNDTIKFEKKKRDKKQDKTPRVDHGPKNSINKKKESENNRRAKGRAIRGHQTRKSWIGPR
jgi:hypothetical protein